MTLWADERFGHVMAYTGDTLEPPEARRRAIALEPMTCPPDAFRSGTDVTVIRPGVAVDGSLGPHPPLTPSAPVTTGSADTFVQWLLRPKGR